MAKLRSLAVCALNIRIHPTHNPSLYESLLKALVALKRPVKVRGDQHYMITHVWDENDVLFGEIASFTNIDPNEPWFNQALGEEAKDEDVEQVSIPEHLKPNFRSASFVFDTKKHLLAFESGGTARGLGKRLVKLLFERLASDKKIRERFGEVSIDIAQDVDELEKMLSLKMIKKIEIILKKPNPDDFGGDEEEVEKLLSDNNAKQYTEVYEAESGTSITPTKRTRTIARVSLQNGKTEITGKDDIGTMRKLSSEDHPAEFFVRYDQDNTTQRTALYRAAIGLFDKLMRSR